MIPKPTEKGYDLFYLDPLTDAGFDPNSPESLRAALTSTKTDRSEKRAALFVLADKVGRDALPDFKAFLYDKNGDLRSSSLACVAFCLESEGSDLYEQLWKDKKYKDKYFLLQVIERYGDSRFEDDVVKTIEKFFKDPLEVQYKWQGPGDNTTLTLAVKYLARIQSSRIDDILKLVAANKAGLGSQIPLIKAALPSHPVAQSL